MSEIDIAKRLFGTTNRVMTANTASSRIQNNVTTSTIGSTSTRYGTVTAIGENNYITILLDGSDEPIQAMCETPVAVNQRVSVVFDNGTITVIALTNFVSQVNTEFEEVRNEITEKGQEIADSVAADIQEVQDSLDDFKATHTYDDATIDTKFQESEDTITANVTASIGEEFVSDAELEVAIGEVTTTVSQTYQTKTDAGTMESNLQAQITTQADRITQEVTDRTEAVSGAIAESKSYTDTQADAITATVTETVTDFMGETYATKSEVQQTADGLNLSISSALTTAENAQAATDNLATTVDANSETVDNVNAYFDFGTDENHNPLLTLGSSNSEMKSEFSNRALSFKSNGTEVMRLEGSSSTVVANKLRMGNYQWQGDGDTLRLIYVGGE